MTTTHALHLSSAIEPATREHLKERADEHDWRWRWRVGAARVSLVACATGCAGLAAATLYFGLPGLGMWEGSTASARGRARGTPVAETCLLVILGLWCVYVHRLDRFLLKPYRPIDISPADLRGTRGACVCQCQSPSGTG
jgi:hypothetical protein